MKQSVLVFDSGSGGLTVWQEIRRRCPAWSTGYVADFHGHPYGTKTDAELLGRIEDLLYPLIEDWQPVLVVIACNTASTLVLEALRRHFTLPFVGVVPAIKVAAVAQVQRVTLLATSATLRRPYIDQLIQQFAIEQVVTRVPADALVGLAESRIRGRVCETQRRETLADLQRELDLLQPQRIVLGCTHFPLLRDWLQPLHPQATWLDSGQAIARRVESLLPPRDGATQSSRHIARYSGKRDELWEQGLGKFGFTQIEQIP